VPYANVLTGSVYIRSIGTIEEASFWNAVYLPSSILPPSTLLYTVTPRSGTG
jgi:hypothetical protein